MSDINKSYSISEASELIGFANHVLRFYEKEFELEIPRNKSGHRYYTYIEIEKFLYIKTLKERGLSNKQIKTIINSPEEIMEMEEIAVTTLGNNAKVSDNIVPINNTNNTEVAMQADFSKYLFKIEKLLEEKLDDNLKNLSSILVQELESTLNNFDGKYKNEDKDALISENARLKMKLKEKSYETAMLREKLKKLQNKKTSFFKRIFSDTNNGV
ncbi:MerR family transcriptional regulator [Paramaledivibacter caminithermalis]|jgi:DNA-binding transcriptional MerR regulator|uniref:MerR HTH family regulatory protein n=1 Tax=Paramaledivibacter caminithermalis (strain DSM 15212 / CIP 107654 / DViRD3) TaxID=1121301 RepID=A0A1M6JLG5_PARC5|nr:MerR family transcriptional regulator [Paramaledivibacter caminithermalis]SHJ47545.1 MerR HTH family regulatory protein [Paramaledivibacter caminithermalis DSM 15212]